ncbi:MULTISPECIES: HD domain-containing protein [unclassified Legionella]|uniref:HD domain-containing protein n=1 Tax=unclassified Legionella TaxID=2622702 RepID=UPI001054697C|nr:MULTISPECIES: phosphohydrolase [unclassified Legionella]MDI9818110.1 phosphohydrolase [Legionella sp. PL877]
MKKNTHTVDFTNLEDASVEDFKFLLPKMQEYTGNVADNILYLLEKQKDIVDGFPVNLYEHSLQTATRAYLDGAEDEMVVVALLHDATMEISHVNNHAEVAAALLKPYISEKNYWILKHHSIFQSYYFFEKIGLDKNGREQFKNHSLYNEVVDFCERWDNPSFDPDYNSKPISFFKPIVRKILSNKD